MEASATGETTIGPLTATTTTTTEWNAADLFARFARPDEAATVFVLIAVAYVAAAVVKRVAQSAWAWALRETRRWEALDEKARRERRPRRDGPTGKRKNSE